MQNNKNIISDIEKNLYNEIKTRIQNDSFQKWAKEWACNISRIKNWYTNKLYNWFNAFNLVINSQDTIFFTEKEVEFLQATIEDKTIFYYVRKTWFTKDEEDEKTKTNNDNEINFNNFHRTYSKVFWLSNIIKSQKLLDLLEKNKEEIQEEKNHDSQNRNIINNIIKKIKDLQVEEIQTNMACYIPALHKIQMPKVWFFNNTIAFDCTFLHELAHSSKKQIFRSFDYATEELVAELSSFIFANSYNISNNESNNNSIAYLCSWLKINESDKELNEKKEKNLLRAFEIATKIFELFDDAQKEKITIRESEDLKILFNEEKTSISLIGAKTFEIKDTLKKQGFKFAFDKVNKFAKWYTTTQNFNKYYIYEM